MAEVNRFGQRIETDYTRKMAHLVSNLKFEDLSEEIVERGQAHYPAYHRLFPSPRPHGRPR